MVTRAHRALSGPLRLPYAAAAIPVSKLEADRCDPVLLGPGSRPDRLETGMFDLFYLALGIGVFALFAAYVFGLRRI
jgi:hypothetical protein